MSQFLPHPRLVIAIPWLGLGGLLLACGCQQVASTAINADGVRLYKQGDYQAASKRFMRAMATNPTDADCYYNLAATHHRLGKLLGQDPEMKQAENLYNQCLDRHPNHVDCYRGLAVLLLDTNRPDAAVRLLEGWAAREPDAADPKIELARLEEELGDRDKAKMRLQEALAVDPDNARALSALGKLRESTGELEQALTVYQRSLQINRFQPEVQARVAVLQTTTGHNVSAPAGKTRLVNQQGRTTRY